MAKGRHTTNTDKKRRRSILYGPVMLVFVCAILIFGMSIFFRATDIQVSGNVSYTADEVIVASGIEEGDNLFFINMFSAASRLYARLPYIETVSISRGLPNRISIEVSESMAIAYVAYEGATSDGLGTVTEYWKIDRNCKLLDRASGVEELTGLIELRGIEIESPASGEIIIVTAEDSAKVEYATVILDQIQERGMYTQVNYLDMSTVGNAVFDYLGRFTVELGAQGNTEYRFGMLISAVGKLQSGDRGVLDLSGDNPVNFISE